MSQELSDAERISLLHDENVKLKEIVRVRTHRERGCMCERCVDDEHHTAKVVGDLRAEVEELKRRPALGGTLIDTGGRRYMVEIEASHDRILEILGVDPLTKLDGLEVGITL